MMNKIELFLIVIFLISSVILVAELFYVLRRRSLFFHRQDPRSAAASSTGAASTCYSKDLLYFYLCLNSSRISRVEPESALPSHNSVSGHSSPEDEMAKVIDVFKLQNMYYGPPRFLFTIKEEERETDAEADERIESGSERSVRMKEVLKAAAGDQDPSAAAGGESVVNELDGEFEAVTTPFSTPCGSPLFLTPSASPIHRLPITAPPLSAADYCEEILDNFHAN